MHEYLTPQDIADTLKISVQKVRNMVRAGELPAIKVGRQWRVRKADFEKYLEGDGG